MPAGLYFGTTTATCIFILKKNKRDNTILFIDASEECIPNSNRGKNDKKVKMLSVTNIENILKLVKYRKYVEYKSKVISFCDIGNFDLSVNAYVKRKDNDNRVNITELDTEIKLIVKRQSALREQFDKIIREIENEEK